MNDDKKLPIMLIADTNENNRTELAEIFRNDYTIAEAVDGLGCLEIMDKNKVEVALIALNMPVMDGFEVLKAAKNDENYKEVPIIIMTNREDSEGEAAAMQLGAAEFLTTPFNDVVARYRVQNVLARYENKRHCTALLRMTV